MPPIPKRRFKSGQTVCQRGHPECCGVVIETRHRKIKKGTRPHPSIREWRVVWRNGHRTWIDQRALDVPHPLEILVAEFES